ncbi:DUF742 domain-containing protein [Amycolatopsis sp. H20-H5]|uniref:DUF742 domain-containing protein n=1 Tax=Amycolatopsis sp. H20-H5 TaxID=3046309 RepID=UPI002DB9946B|nr:DUF742 domain-containing protein [Amycolatopsis sp. H20-H5]MEC3981593.1 DUF742 domain-containing protein [Amycolatopsis sp. H20-H5]
MSFEPAGGQDAHPPRHALRDRLEPPPRAVDPHSPRPYLLTAGRVRPEDDTVEIEAQVVTSSRGRAACAELTFERRDIVELCAAAMSVAEVAGSLGLHLGVARVLIGDVVDQGYLVVLRPHEEIARDPEILRRVLRGLRAIS